MIEYKIEITFAMESVKITWVCWPIIFSAPDLLPILNHSSPHCTDSLVGINQIARHNGAVEYTFSTVETFLQDSNSWSECFRIIRKSWRNVESRVWFTSFYGGESVTKISRLSRVNDRTWYSSPQSGLYPPHCLKLFILLCISETMKCIRETERWILITNNTVSTI